MDISFSITRNRRTKRHYSISYFSPFLFVSVSLFDMALNYRFEIIMPTQETCSYPVRVGREVWFWRTGHKI